jgi:hypothetical protein
MNSLDFIYSGGVSSNISQALKQSAGTFIISVSSGDIEKVLAYKTDVSRPVHPKMLVKILSTKSSVEQSVMTN